MILLIELIHCTKDPYLADFSRQGNLFLACKLFASARSTHWAARRQRNQDQTPKIEGAKNPLSSGSCKDKQPYNKISNT